MTPVPGDADACRELGAYLTGAEATQLGDRLAAGQPLSMAVSSIGAGRRGQVLALIGRTGLDEQPALIVPLLRAVEGAHSGKTSISTVWTAPGSLARQSSLTASVYRLVEQARESVICSTFNFQRSSALWDVLVDVSARPEVAVRIYMDRKAADSDPAPWKPTTHEVAQTMKGAVVLRTTTWDDKAVANHAKFIAVDHQYLIVTSANFSMSGEQRNVELGLRLEDPLVTQAVERQMSELERHVYERVPQ